MSAKHKCKIVKGNPRSGWICAYYDCGDKQRRPTGAEIDEELRKTAEPEWLRIVRENRGGE